jgi:hypothetical protein
MFVQQAPGAPAGGLEEGIESTMPGFEAFVDKYEKLSDRQDKLNKRMLHDIAGARTDLQRMGRELEQVNDNHDVILARLENILGMLERMLGGGAPQGGM